mmetsp:Transcript_29987/g.75625  ORF Transcript_29987/g.75625 Transcript_29987/m.75625 type:complete len:84 (-) Transcript_29987:825-1076(-)
MASTFTERASHSRGWPSSIPHLPIVPIVREEGAYRAAVGGETTPTATGRIVRKHIIAAEIDYRTILTSRALADITLPLHLGEA